MQAKTFFLHLTIRVGRRFFLFFYLLLLIIFSSKWKSDSLSHENQQLKQAKQNTIEPARLPGSYKEALNHLIIFLVHRKIRTFIDAVVDKLFKVSL